MSFTTFDFVLYFPLIIILYNLVPRQLRLTYLLAVSYLLYGLLQPFYLLLLILTTSITYLMGRWIAWEEKEDKKKKLLFAGLIAILTPLFLFKYAGPIENWVATLMTSMGISVKMATIRWVLPLGISYYTFMSVGYLVDLYNEEVEVEKDPQKVALFLSFFPIVMSGPIERAGNMFPQFSKMERSTPEDIIAGFKILLWGYFLKLCVANRLAVFVAAVYGNVAMHSSKTLCAAALIFPIEEYADLAGYSLLAIGSARCMGFAIIPNFRRPFFATSLSSFWRRWHMSLIQWLTDYIYTPMSYCLRGWKSWGIVASLMVTFLVSGIWHGATMTCVAWGLMQGIVLSTEAVLLQQRTAFEKKYHLQNKWWYIAVNICFVYIFFAFSEIYGMSSSFEQANHIIARILTASGPLFVDAKTFTYGAIMVTLLVLKDLRDEYMPNRFQTFESKNICVRYISYVLLIVLILHLGVMDGSQFLYFQF